MSSLIDTATEQERFFALAAPLPRAKNPAEQTKLPEELARLTFGE
jgi:hypothetical protein